MKAFAAILILSLTLSFSVIAQNRKGQIEINAPLNPWALLLSKSYFLQYEQFLSSNYSVTATAGYQGQDFGQSYFSNSRLTGYRGDIGFRRYHKGETQRVFRTFVGTNFTVEKSTIRLQERGNVEVPMDSLSASGFSFGPELIAGFKIVILKRIILTPAVGLRYYFSTINRKGLTYNPKYWAYDDWNNGKPEWYDNRRIDVDMFGYRKGLAPIVYLNLGATIRL